MAKDRNESQSVQSNNRKSFLASSIKVWSILSGPVRADCSRERTFEHILLNLNVLWLELHFAAHLVHILDTMAFCSTFCYHRVQGCFRTGGLCSLFGLI